MLACMHQNDRAEKNVKQIRNLNRNNKRCRGKKSAQDTDARTSYFRTMNFY